MPRKNKKISRTNNKLTTKSYFSKANPYESVRWERFDTEIRNEDNEVIFVQKNFEFPDFYSPLARSVIASRYAYGEIGTSERESSFKTIVERIADTYPKWGLKQGYFDERTAENFRKDLTWLLLHQYLSPNSPVWFNVGTEKYESRISKGPADANEIDGYTIKNGKVIPVLKKDSHLYPQTSACFIQEVSDSMRGIMELATNEAMIFKDGSGTGTDLSTLRSSREKLSGGGKPSGPLAYLTFYDDVAGIVQSGGKTRRAAKMDSLKVWHPDVKEFIEAKMEEQKKIRALVKQGYSPEKATKSFHFQNTNFSIRVNDEFMNAVINDEEWQTTPVHTKELAAQMPRYKARDLWNLIAKATWECGDPGIQYDDTINKWHTCPNSGKINASNPCSEYMFIDNSACNLASVNLMKFRKPDGSFDVEGFKKTFQYMTWMMDLNVDNSRYPTEKIAKNAHRFRPLGGGYSNLGAFLMSYALPYDSEEARATAAAITSLMTAEIYKTSTELAEKLGTFKEYEKNKEPMLRVIEMHKAALDNIDETKLPDEIKPVYEASKKTWNEVLKRGRKFGFRNAQASLLAPTGTISFPMDCDTTGVEPETALVKYKRLSEGGLLKIVNQTVPLALERLGYKKQEINDILEYITGHKNIEGTPYLKREHYDLIKGSRNKQKELKKLGYSDTQIKDIILYLEGHETIEGAPHLKEEHLPVFDCSLKAPNGKRSIHYKGHIEMLAAVQPFLSGSISKTINMPQETTVEEIADAYMYGWRKGLKAMSIYRDTSKELQPLTAGRRGLEEKLSPEPAKRVRLPPTRKSITHKFTLNGHDCYFTVGEYPDGKPGEIFITMAKEGSTLGGMMDCFGTAISIALQHGVPLENFAGKFIGSTFEPMGWVEEGDRVNIRTAKSFIDYIFRWLRNNYSSQSDKESNLDSSNKVIENNKSFQTENSPQPKGLKVNFLCPVCGNLDYTYKLGNCGILCDPEMGGCGHLDLGGCGQ